MRGVDHEQSLPLLLEAGPSSGHHAQASENPVSIVRRHLRGRWKQAVALSLAFCVLGAVGGFFSTKAKYTSTGMVEIKPTLPSLMYTQEENKLPPMFESFVKAQAAYLQAPRVLDRAVNDPTMKEVGWPLGGDGVTQLQDALTVVYEKGSQIILVKVADPNPQAATRGVNAVLRAYKDIYGEQSGLSVSERERQLDRLNNSFQTDLSALKEDTTKLQEQFGPEVQTKAFEARQGDLEKVNQRLQELTLVIGIKEKKAEMGAAASAAAGAPAVAEEKSSEEDYARSDEPLARLRNEREKIDADIKARSVRFGPHHLVMRELLAQRAAKQNEIDARVELLRKSGVATGIPSTGSSAAAASLVDRPLDELKMLAGQYQAQKDQMSKEISDITRKRTVLANRDEQITDMKQKLEKTQQALDELRTEKKNTDQGRVRTQEGDIPFKASSDKRVMRAGAGAFAGVCGGTGLVLLLGMLRGRYRYIEDLEHGVQAPLLGTLPELTSGDGEQDELAAGSVHHVRNMLQLQHTRRVSDGARIYAITSASAGEGKTSLSLALGMSFAAAGHRTLLIDADLYGRGLTKSLGMRGIDGLSEAAIAKDLNGEVHETGFPNVWAIPAGRSEGFDAQNLSKPRMSALLDHVRAEFDIVVVDTGPLLGSIEANLGAALADGVVLMVTRGQDSKLVRACLKRIMSVGGVCAGLVFNRAIRQDFERSVSSNSFRSNAPRLQGETLDAPSKDSSLLRALGGRKDGAGGPS